MADREMVSFAEIEQILSVLDERGISRELIEIPLGTGDPWGIKPLPGRRIRLTVPSTGDFDAWLHDATPQILTALRWEE
jgi:hypothetical protein